MVGNADVTANRAKKHTNDFIVTGVLIVYWTRAQIEI